MLVTKEAAAQQLASGAVAMVAGPEALLVELPRGNWIGGTIPYFMSDDGGVVTEDRVYLTVLPSVVELDSTRSYRADQLSHIVDDAPEHGLTGLIIPAGSEPHTIYAAQAPSYPGMFMKPIFGWISGVHLRDLSVHTPKVIDGRTGEVFADRAIALHAKLPPGKEAEIKIVNLFKQGSGDHLTFPCDGFVVEDCQVHGETRNFADYLIEQKIDTRLPLVADYSGAMVNVSIQEVDAKGRKVKLYAPVFEGVDYRIAAPVEDYVGQFTAEIRGKAAPTFACNCILNFLYSELEGKSTGAFTGPVTFGEIAYQLLNQTLVYVEITG